MMTTNDKDFLALITSIIIISIGLYLGKGPVDVLILAFFEFSMLMIAARTLYKNK